MSLMSLSTGRTTLLFWENYVTRLMCRQRVSLPLCTTRSSECPFPILYLFVLCVLKAAIVLRYRKNLGKNLKHIGKRSSLYLAISLPVQILYHSQLRSNHTFPRLEQYLVVQLAS